ncbi:MAG: Na+/H+ antiporter NhaA [Pseudonocardiaceae bacterium]
MSESTRRTLGLFGRGSWAETRRIADILRKETIGGALLLSAAVVALAWANSAWSDSYQALLDYRLGPASLHLNLTLAQWAADGLLAIFFFVAGLELKREFVAGDLRDPWRAAVPVAAAIGGVLVPATCYLLVNLGASDGAAAGWAIPTATDIAFALAVLAVIGCYLPSALRTFLLTLAVVDDLLAILIIAVFYTRDLAFVPLLAALAPLALFTVYAQRRVRSWWVLLPLAAATWALVHASGVHATVAGVLLGFAVPVIRSQQAGGPDAGPGLAEHFEHRWRPISAGVAVPVFAFCSAGVTISGLNALTTALTDHVTVGIVLGLVVGKPIGILAATYLVARFTRASLDEGLAWVDVLGLAILAGIGFTVSLLIGELAFGAGSERDEHVKIAVLTGSLLAAALAAVILRLRNRIYRRIHETETAGHARRADD